MCKTYTNSLEETGTNKIHNKYFFYFQKRKIAINNKTKKQEKLNFMLNFVCFLQEQLKIIEAEVRKLNSALTTQEAETKLKQIETENTEMMVSKF